MKAMVTGGGGFLGRRLVELLLQEGHEVHFLARGLYPEVEALGATSHQVDLLDAGALPAAMQGIDTVFHVAAKAGVWGRESAYYDVNVRGTGHLITAARQVGVTRFIYTSTPSVVSYDEPIENGAMDLPYASHYKAHYPKTKAMAERLVLKANCPEMATVSLRPHLIFGPGDPHLLTRFVRSTLEGRLRVIGDGQNKVDFTYVDNAAWAHIDAAHALSDHTAPCAGRAYFISNDEPVSLWGWFNELLEQMEVPRIEKRLPHRTARFLFGLIEWMHRLFPLGEPAVTAFLADAMATSHWFDMSPAKQDLGYHVRIPMRDAMGPTSDYLKSTIVDPFLKGSLG